jgi:hypothetical protein
MASGLAPTDNRESALQVSLKPGNYTVIVSSGQRHARAREMGQVSRAESGLENVRTLYPAALLTSLATPSMCIFSG